MGYLISVRPSNVVTEIVSSCCFISTANVTVTSIYKSGESIPSNGSQKLLLQVVPGKNNCIHVATIIIAESFKGFIFCR